ncbi:NifU family protein [Clostridium estertheticum]|uniref:NifU family protein n=1 Tax=Clostridium estertheticum TaxID=238834 RepID=UPI001CF140CB|nr:NifU family protein [Clostridium estertheticum]MCB2358834.1 NifU family protein [Clostridium estertheticum]
MFTKEDMFAKIEKILEMDVRPKLADHYGNIELVNICDGIVEVKLLGQCKGCLSAKYTVEDLVEATLKEAIPDIKKVILINQINEELLEQARKILNEGSKACASYENLEAKYEKICINSESDSIK